MDVNMELKELYNDNYVYKIRMITDDTSVQIDNMYIVIVEFKEGLKFITKGKVC